MDYTRYVKHTYKLLVSKLVSEALVQMCRRIFHFGEWQLRRDEENTSSLQLLRHLMWENNYFGKEVNIYLVVFFEIFSDNGVPATTPSISSGDQGTVE